VGSRKINLSTSLAEQLVGIREVDDQVWQVSFLEYDLGYFDRELFSPPPSTPENNWTLIPNSACAPRTTHILKYEAPLKSSTAPLAQSASLEARK